MRLDLVFLSAAFWEAHPACDYPEIERKELRPYLALVVESGGHRWAVPFRSNVRHEWSFLTDEERRCGLDYTKAVLVDDPAFVDSSRRPYLRKAEFEALRGAERRIEEGFARYLRHYAKARRSGHPRYAAMLRFSTLQYFEEALELS